MFLFFFLLLVFCCLRLFIGSISHGVSYNTFKKYLKYILLIWFSLVLLIKFTFCDKQEDFIILSTIILSVSTLVLLYIYFVPSTVKEDIHDYDHFIIGMKKIYVLVEEGAISQAELVEIFRVVTGNLNYPLTTLQQQEFIEEFLNLCDLFSKPGQRISKHLLTTLWDILLTNPNIGVHTFKPSSDLVIFWWKQSLYHYFNSAFHSFFSSPLAILLLILIIFAFTLWELKRIKKK